MILQHLRGRECLLIIDEAQHLMLPALESLRNIHDATECGHVLMGNEAVYSRLSGRRSAEFAQLYSRVGSVLKLENPLPSDTTALARQWGVKEKPAAAISPAKAKAVAGNTPLCSSKCFATQKNYGFLWVFVGFCGFLWVFWQSKASRICFAKKTVECGFAPK